MKKLFWSLSICFLLTSFSSKGSPSISRFFKKSNLFFKSYVKAGKVNYDLIKNNQRQISQIVKMIEEVDINSLSEKEYKAFYINSYNLLVIHQIVNSYPLESPYEIEGFYTDNHFIVGGEKLSLSQMEQEKLLNRFKDFRITFALCAGTMGSFPLASFAYIPEKIDKQINFTIRNIVNSESYVRIKKNSSRILFSDGFIVFRKFENFKTIIKGLNQHREFPLPDSYSVDFYPSNKAVNTSEVAFRY